MDKSLTEDDSLQPMLLLADRIEEWHTVVADVQKMLYKVPNEAGVASAHHLLNRIRARGMDNEKTIDALALDNARLQRELSVAARDCIRLQRDDTELLTQLASFENEKDKDNPEEGTHLTFDPADGTNNSRAIERTA